MIGRAAKVWASSPQRAAMAIDRLMALRLVTGASIVAWAFSELQVRLPCCLFRFWFRHSCLLGRATDGAAPGDRRLHLAWAFSELQVIHVGPCWCCYRSNTQYD